MIPTVYVVDDDESICRAIVALAESLGMRGISFQSAEGFLQVQPIVRPGCLVTDIILEGMSGIDLVNRVSQSENPIPTIVISAFADVPNTVRAMEGGAITLIEKPCEARRLATAIKDSIAWDTCQLERDQHLTQLQASREKLTKREHKVLDFLVVGGLNKEIARALEVSVRTIEGDRAKILQKFNVVNAVELAVKYTECRMLSDRNYRFDWSAQMSNPHWRSSVQIVAREQVIY